MGLFCTFLIYCITVPYAVQRFEALVNHRDELIRNTINPEGTSEDTVFQYTIGELDPETGFDFRYAFVLNEGGSWPKDFMRIASFNAEQVT